MSIDTLRKAVQFNCDLSDREFAADYTICIYLIRMREYYRWSEGIPVNESLEQEALLDWNGSLLITVQLEGDKSCLS